MKKRLCKQTCEGKNKTNKNQGFLSNNITHARTSLRTHEFNLRAQARSCVRRSLPKNPNQHRNSERTKQDIKCKTEQPSMLKDIKKT